MKRIGEWILTALKNNADEKTLQRIRGEVSSLCEQFPVPAAAFDAASADLLARPEILSIVADGAGQLRGRVTKSVFLGAVQHCEIVLSDGTCVRLGAPPDRALPPGERITVAVDVERAWLMREAAP